jgi:voltage-gated potassium channel Kch
MTTHRPQDRTRVRRWIERLTIWRAIRTIVLVAIVLVLVGGLLVRLIEPKVFTSYGLACWYAVSTVTTVGYGDVVPETTGGRIVGTVLMLAGVSLIPLVTSVTVAILTTKQSLTVDDDQDERMKRIEKRLDELGG